MNRKEWQPIHHSYGNDYARALAALSLADVVLVNSVADGMNLVAKEALVVSERNSVLVLSRQAGAWEEFADWVLSVDPEDDAGTAQVLAEALSMSEEERTRRNTELAKIVEANDLAHWLTTQLTDLNQIQNNR